MAAWTDFHENCGRGIVLSEQGRRATRKSPGSEFDNGLVFTKGLLPEKTVFEIEIEQKTALWSGSLALGVTLNDPNCLSEIPTSISHLENGTWAVAGTSVLKDGFSCCDDYAGNLEELVVGDKVGVIRFTNGELHFLVNGKDMGCAAKDIPNNVFVVVDVYGRCSQVKVCSKECSEDGGDKPDGAVGQINELRFHEYCGSCVKLTNNRKTIFRPNPNEDFNNAVALTDRPLAKDEILELKMDTVIDKWAGSLEIGVTTHAPGSFQLPATMTNIPSGTWMFSGGAIVHNGTTIVEAYGKDISTYQVDDKLALCVRLDNSLHFYYNGIDLGKAVSNLPPSPLYAVVDLYGQAVKVSIVNYGPINEVLQPPAVVQPQGRQRLAGGTENQVATSDKSQPRFSETHGRLITLTEDRTGASRLNALTEFNHAVVVSEQPLQDNCLFEIEIENTTDRWSGSLEVGLLSLAPPDLQLPPTLTDLDHHTWVLSGTSVMHDGITIMNGYGVDLDTVEVGSRVGVMRKSDGSFHVFLDGQDKGTAATLVPPGVFAAIDLYGRCVQVAIVISGHTAGGRSRSSSSGSTESLIDESMLDLLYSFHCCGGENIVFRNHGHTAVRTRNFDGGLVCSDKPLQDERIFEVRIDKMDHTWTGSLSIGVTSSHLPVAQAPLQIGELSNNTVYLSGSSIFKDGVKVRAYGVSLDRVKEGSRVGIQRRVDGTLHVYVDSKHCGIAAANIPENVFGIVDLYGTTQSISIVNTTNRIYSDRSHSSDEECGTTNPTQLQAESEIPDLSFHSKCGLNIIMDATCTTARRNAKFNDGVVFSRKPLTNKEMFQVRVDSFNPTWSGSLAVGAIGMHSLEKLNLSATAVSLRLNSCVLVHGSLIYINGVKSDLQYHCNLDNLRDGDRVGVVCDEDNHIHIIVNDVDQGFIDHVIPGVKYAIFDLYGRCEQLSVVASSKELELRKNNVWNDDRKEKGKTSEEEDEKSEHELSGDNDYSLLPCDYKQCCQRFQVTLGIPEQYFTKNITCYCFNCSTTRGESSDVVSGDPPQESRRPTGWCKFELRLPPSVDASQIFRQFHVAYVGVYVGAIRRTLDRGTVLPPRKSNRIIDGMNSEKNMISPCVERAMVLSNEKNFLFTDTTSCKRWSTQVAFELRLPANSYTLCPNSKTELGNRDWLLELPRKIVLAGLLVRITEEDR